jgi:hypothetical protein
LIKTIQLKKLEQGRYSTILIPSKSSLLKKIDIPKSESPKKTKPNQSKDVRILKNVFKLRSREEKNKLANHTHSVVEVLYKQNKFSTEKKLIGLPPKPYKRNIIYENEETLRSPKYGSFASIENYSTSKKEHISEDANDSSWFPTQKS